MKEIIFQLNTALVLVLGDLPDRAKLTVDFALDYWIKKGFPAGKIALGLATYGRAFKYAIFSLVCIF